jgi:hypothetical protein
VSVFSWQAQFLGELVLGLLSFQVLHLRPRPFDLGNVTHDFRSADGLSRSVFDRRGGNRDINRASILAQPHGFQLTGVAAASDAFEIFCFLLRAIWRNQPHDRLS